MSDQFSRISTASTRQVLGRAVKLLKSLKRTGAIDLLLITSLLAWSPVLRHFGESMFDDTPDTIAYISMGERLFSDSLLYAPTCNDPSSGITLPPVYPFLIGAGALLEAGPFLAAYRIAAGAVILATLGLYFLVRIRAGPVVALSAAATAQSSFYFSVFASTAITEGLFILSTMLLLLAIIGRTSDSGAIGDFIVGCAAGAVFLTRSIGIVLGAVALGVQLIRICRQHDLVLDRRPWRVASLFAGPLLVVIPYCAALYSQTGLTPFQQAVRLDAQESLEVDPEILAMIRAVSEQEVSDYSELMRKRRQMRQLLPDSSATYAEAARRIEESDGPLGLLWRRIRDPAGILRDTWANSLHLKTALGSVPFLLLLLACGVPVLHRSTHADTLDRILIPAMLLSYLVVLSTLTTLVPRYVYVLVPFAAVQIAFESHIVASSLFSQRSMWRPVEATVAVLLLVAVLAPHSSGEIRYQRPPSELVEAFGGFDGFVEPGEPVLSIKPKYPHLLGGCWVPLPNDELPKVIRYATVRGIRWILVTVLENDWREIDLYDSSAWYKDPYLYVRNPHLIRYEASVLDGKVALYRVL